MKKSDLNSTIKKLVFLISLTIVLSASVSSCSWFSSDEEEDKKSAEEILSKPADVMYKEAMDLRNSGKLTKAVEMFQEIERLYPFSAYANKAKVSAAYSQYQDEEYDKAIDIIDEFVSLNPGNDEVSFMYYLKAICYYDRIQDVKRDQEITIKAQAAFNELINRFADSKYARDSKLKLDLINDHLAAKEMEVGRFYLKQKNYIAAINRFKEVVKKYDNTQQIEEALYRLTETNYLLGFEDEALKYATVLGYNYPSSPWYKSAYALTGNGKSAEDNKTFVGKMLDSVGLGSEEDYAKPLALESSPNIIDTGGWITDDSAISNEAAPATSEDVVPEKVSEEKIEADKPASMQ